MQHWLNNTSEKFIMLRASAYVSPVLFRTWSKRMSSRICLLLSIWTYNQRKRIILISEFSKSIKPVEDVSMLTRKSRKCFDNLVSNLPAGRETETVSFFFRYRHPWYEYFLYLLQASCEISEVFFSLAKNGGYWGHLQFFISENVFSSACILRQFVEFMIRGWEFYPRNFTIAYNRPN